MARIDLPESRLLKIAEAAANHPPIPRAPRLRTSGSLGLVPLHERNQAGRHQ